MKNVLRIFALAVPCAFLACSNVSTPIPGLDGGFNFDGGPIPLPDGGFLLPDGGVVLPDGGALPGACQTHSDCTGGLVCIAGLCGSAASAGAGSPCSATLDCQGSLYCSPLGFCAPAGTGASDAGCTSDGDCVNGLRCNYEGFGGSCGAAGTTDLGGSCAQQSDCTPGLFCSTPGASGRSCQPFALAFPQFTGPVCQDDGPLRAYFEIPRPGQYPKDFFRLPYPNDIRVTGATGGEHLDISDFPTPGVGILDFDLVAMYRDALVADFDGFSPIAPVTFRFSAGIDTGTLDSTIQFIDLTDPTTTNFFLNEYTYSINGNHYNCDNRLTTGPGELTPLRAGHTYAVVLETGIKDSAGNAVATDSDFTALVSDTAPTDSNLQHAYQAYAPLRAYLDDPNNHLPAANLISAAVFTVADPLKSMTAVAAAVAALPAPTITDLELCGSGGTPSTCDALGSDHTCTASDSYYEIHGRMSLPIFQEGTEPYLHPDAGGGIVLDGNGNAVHQRDEAVCFALTVPKTAAPAGGWPLVITHHGTGGSMTDFIHNGVAPTLAAAGTPMAVLGFDAVEHAERRGGSTASPDDLVFNALNPRAARDNFLQGAADILGEAKLAGSTITVGGGPGAVTFDATRVVFFGHSQGSTSGEIAVPFLDAAPVTVLSGASSHLTQSLLHKTSPQDLKQGIALLIQEDPSQLDTEHPVLGLFQNYFDRSDPLSYTGHIINSPLTGHIPHDVFMTWGTHDTYTPLETLHANAVSLGVPISGSQLEGSGFSGPIARPVSDNLTTSGVSVTGVMVQYDTPANDDGHFVAFDVGQAQTDWTHYIESSLSGPPALQ